MLDLGIKKMQIRRRGPVLCAVLRGETRRAACGRVLVLVQGLFKSAEALFAMRRACGESGHRGRRPRALGHVRHICVQLRTVAWSRLACARGVFEMIFDSSLLVLL